MNIKKSVSVFLIINNELPKREIKKWIPFTIATEKEQTLRNKFNKGDKRPIHWRLEYIVETEVDKSNGKIFHAHILKKK